ncbi:hypothetical protein AWB81_01891 [Caballeronia arationis]|uniref:DUF4262 domain-containing protein n=1 Tax=Caballeronia arationis TaxID=1777142 RepID=UPI00074B6533|nr:DUF4262 domain-containing protein [Caballeronia arationis]SAK59762.1 hypothetical protein AWB81_01891 [Caballeronia arationis]
MHKRSPEQIDATAEALRSELAAKIEKYGYTQLVIFPTEDDPDVVKFMYTIGLTKKGLPEILVSGNVTNQGAMDMIASVVSELERNNGQIKLGVRDDLFSVRVDLRDVTSPVARDEYACQAVTMYGEHVRVLQVVWADLNNVLPNEEGYDSAKCVQELLPMIH